MHHDEDQLITNQTRSARDLSITRIHRRAEPTTPFITAPQEILQHPSTIHADIFTNPSKHISLVPEVPFISLH